MKIVCSARMFKVVYYRPTEYREELMYNGMPKISSMITNIACDQVRTKIICNVLLELPDARNVLVLSDRISQLQDMYRILGPSVSGMFVGKLKKEQKDDSKKKRILLATYAIANEGFDHPKLNTLMFATPRSSVTQSIGRIYRKVHTNVVPLIIDVVDQFSVFPYQRKKRLTIYDTHINTFERPSAVTECLFD